MLTLDEKNKIIKEKIDTLAQSFFDVKNRLEEIESTASDKEKDEIIGLLLKKKISIEYFNGVLESLKNGIDPV
jgi:hypothetical protein